MNAKTFGFLAFLIAFSVLSARSALAQTSDEVRHAPDGGTKMMIASISIPPLPNAPFTATVNTEWTRTLGNGSTVTLKNRRTVARDSTGRIYEERRYLSPNGDRQQTGIRQLEFSDPTTHEVYICDVETHVCDLRDYFPSTSIGRPVIVEAGSQNDLKTEDLGHDSISGLDTVGTRETSMIAAGAVGNDQPLAAVKEFWYSSQLGVNLVVNRVDPRTGTEKFRVTDITLGEPNAKFFKPPTDYTVVDARRPATSPSK